jgi:hypothetical protein
MTSDVFMPPIIAADYGGGEAKEGPEDGIPSADLEAAKGTGSPFHLLVSVDGNQLTRFMEYVDSNLAREVKRLYDWPEHGTGITRPFSSARRKRPRSTASATSSLMVSRRV